MRLKKMAMRDTNSQNKFQTETKTETAAKLLRCEGIIEGVCD